MGLFGWLFGGRASKDSPDQESPTKDDFAKLMTDALRQAGETQNLHFDREQFHLIREGEHPALFNLHNVYQEYCAAAVGNRPEILRHFVRSWFSNLKEVPTDFADARCDLLPVIRTRAYYEFARLQLQAQGVAETDWPHRILAEHLAIGLAYDLPESMKQIQQQSFTDWGVSFEQALDAASGNLRELSKPRFEMPQPGVWTSPFRDNYDTARLLLPDLIRDYSVKGDPIAMIPNRDMLLFTGSEDLDGLENMLRLADEGLAHPRPISGRAFRLHGDTWQPFLPATGHPLLQQFKLLSVKIEGAEYADQLQLLEHLHKKTGEDIYVGRYSLRKDTGEIVSFTAWSKGVACLLPRTDLIHFFVAEGDDGVVAATAAWDKVMRIVGNLLEPTGMYPVRYRVKGFPSDEQLELLKH